MNILLTSAGRRTYLVEYFKEALGDQGKIFVSNSDKQSPAFQAADETVVTPLIYDEAYVPFLVDYCQEKQIETIIPLFDIDVFVLSKNKAVFAENQIQVIVGDWPNIAFCNDKYATFEVLREQHFLVPLTVNSLKAAQALLETKQLNYPVMVKPRWGMGSIGIYQANNSEELAIFYKKTQKDIQNSYLKYEAKIDMEHAVIIQEKIEAVEYGLDVINDLNGVYQTTIVKQKGAMRAGETDFATVVNDPKLKELGKRLAALVKQPGNLDVDVLHDGKNGYVLELNARFGGGYPFSHLAGVNLPKALIRWLKGQEISNELVEEYDVTGYKDLVIKKYN